MERLTPKNVVNALILMLALNILQKGVQIIEKDVKMNINGKLCQVAGTVKLRVPVTTKVPVLLPETINEASLEGEN